jgi:rhodanese-related sulfurtransferase
MRSQRVAQWLRQNGFVNTQSMRGGIDAWSDLVDPEMPRY